MKRLFLFAAALLMSAGASAQVTFYQDKYNVDMLRVAAPREPLRNEFVLPKVNGYKVLKADLHTHTIFSDGTVTTSFRVREAWFEGLDVLAITEHIEYRPFDQNMVNYLNDLIPENTKATHTNIINAGKDEKIKVAPDMNYSIRLAESSARRYGITLIPAVEITRNPHHVGHYNALFIKDANAIYDPDPMVSIRNARAQGALIMQNHPGWVRRNVDIIDFEQQLYDAGMIDGVEVMNDTEFYPPIITRAVEKNLFVASNTDVHDSTTIDFFAQGYRRPMTFILAEDNSLESIKSALKARRTLAYFYGALAGEEQLIKDFFMACVKFETFRVDGNGKRTMHMVNNTSMHFALNFGGNPVELRPFTSRIVSVAKDKELVFTVENMWIPGEKHPVIRLKF